VLFEDYRIPDNPTIGSLFYTTQSATTQSHPELDIKSILKKLASGFLVVVKRKLEGTSSQKGDIITFQRTLLCAQR
jgi:hypothetical protein